MKGNESADYLAKIAASCITTTAYVAIPINRGKQMLEDYYINIWNATYIHYVNASHTKLFIPTIFPSPLTQLHSHTVLNKSQQLPFIPPQNEQDALANLQLSRKGCKTAHHLMTECSLFSNERPTVLQTLPPPLALKCHINSVGITSFVRNIFHMLQEQLKSNQTP